MAKKRGSGGLCKTDCRSETKHPKRQPGKVSRRWVVVFCLVLFVCFSGDFFFFANSLPRGNVAFWFPSGGRSLPPSLPRWWHSLDSTLRRQA